MSEDSTLFFEGVKTKYLGLGGDLKALTGLTKAELIDLIQIHAFLELVKNLDLNNFDFKDIENDLLKLKISEKRKGREEILKIGQHTRLENVLQYMAKKKTPFADEGLQEEKEEKED
jgi:hypothetical protein